MAGVDTAGAHGAGVALMSENEGGSRAERELRGKIEQWTTLLESGNATPEALQQVLRDVQVAMKDPEQARILAANGIDQGSVDRLQAGLDDHEAFDHKPWLTMFSGLSNISGKDDLGITSPARMALFNFDTQLEALKLSNMSRVQTEQQSALSEIDSLIGKAEERGEPVSLTQETVDAANKAEFTGSDVGSDKFARALEGGDPSEETYSVEELRDIRSGMEKKASTSNKDTQATMLELQELHNKRTELLQLTSSISAREHDVMMKMIAATGSS